MKCSIPEISWHNREPVLSVDLSPAFDSFYRLASGGADHHVLIWKLVINDNGSLQQEVLADLKRHQRAVNVVRWSSNGQYLASADDDANIIIWHLKTDNIPLLEGETNDKEVWIVFKTLRGHKEDIYDLTWSPNSLKLLSGSVDNSAIVWDLDKGKNETILSDHKGFVQGVCYDPKEQYMAVMCAAGICTVYCTTNRYSKIKIQRGPLPVSEQHDFHQKEVKYFYDDTFKSFFRRLSFSPDGSILVVPSGHIQTEDCKQTLNATLVFATENWQKPIAVLPSQKQCSTVVRFCPLLFELRDKGPKPIIPLPYRMIFAVGTDHDVILYDTQQMTPFALLHQIHYTRLTDLTWSKDGLLLVASSTDGYCSLITFDNDELGTEWKAEVEMDTSMNVSGCELLEKEVKPKKPNLLEKWTIKTPKRGNKSDNINVLTPKRLRMTDNKTSVKEKNLDNSPVGPLKKILKSPRNAKSKKIDDDCVIIEDAEIILEPARDAWPSKDEKIVNETMEIDESTDLAISLQMEESTQKTLDSHPTENGISKLSVVSQTQNNSQTESKTKTNAIKQGVLETSKCPSNNESLPIEIKPKRRIPLITLSSPKTRKLN